MTKLNLSDWMEHHGSQAFVSPEKNTWLLLLHGMEQRAILLLELYSHSPSWSCVHNPAQR